MNRDLIFVFVVGICVFLTFSMVGGLIFFASEVVTMKYNYICDGKDIDDVCRVSRFVNGGVHIRGCESGKEYFCQSIVEIPLEDQDA